MKKIFKVISYVCLILITLVSFTGCSNVIKEKISAKNDKNISLGKWEDNVYKNDFLNIEYTLPENWSKYSDEEIAEAMDLGKELLNDEQKMSQKLAELTTVTYMMTSDPSTGNNVILMSEKPILKNMTAENYLNALKTSIEKSENISYEVDQPTSETINGIKYNTLLAKASYSGVELKQKYYVRKQGKYFIGIIATSTTGDEGLNQIASAFKKIK